MLPSEEKWLEISILLLRTPCGRVPIRRLWLLAHPDRFRFGAFEALKAVSQPDLPPLSGSSNSKTELFSQFGRNGWKPEATHAAGCFGAMPARAFSSTSSTAKALFGVTFGVVRVSLQKG